MKTLLILDDEQVLREAFAAYFEDHSWHPLLAANAEEALQIIKTETAVAVLVDIRLIGTGGEDFIRKARMIQPNLAFVICTGSHEYEIPPDILAYPQVSNNIFKKPVYNLADLENEITQTVFRVKNLENSK